MVGRSISVVLFLLIFSATGAVAQAEKMPVLTKGKAAYIDTELFGDKTRGIKKFVRAIANMNPENLPESAALRRQIGDLQSEINALIAQKKSINEAYQKQAALVSRLNQEQLEMRRRENIFIKPVWKDIQDKAKEYAALRGYSIILDRTDLKLAFVPGEAEDVTEDFIKFCNDAFEKEKT
jgi:Skp family chaperone for outer membrane proteins